jgi:drug/metabolite transporter (DMT)-like permease
VSVLIVGGTALLASSSSSSSVAGDDDGGTTTTTTGSTGSVTASETLLGVSLMIAGALVQAVQFVFEERVMKMDVPVPPLLLIGMEGFWGVVIGMFVMYPIG